MLSLSEGSSSVGGVGTGDSRHGQLESISPPTLDERRCWTYSKQSSLRNLCLRNLALGSGQVRCRIKKPVRLGIGEFLADIRNLLQPHDEPQKVEFKPNPLKIDPKCSPSIQKSPFLAIRVPKIAV